MSRSGPGAESGGGVRADVNPGTQSEAGAKSRTSVKPLAGTPFPSWMWVPAVVAAGFVAFPIVGLVLRADWPEFFSLVTAPSALQALRLSLVTATCATVFSVLLGIPLALLTVREFPGVRLLRTVVLLPLVLPPVVGGIALLAAFGRAGLIGSSLEAAGVSIAFTTVAVVVAQTFVAMPFVVLTVEGALTSLDPGFAKVATTLGAGPTRTLFRIVLPLIRPALISGAVLAFARALGEFGATVTFAGSLQGVTRTLPLEVYLLSDSGDTAGAIALSVVLMVVAFVVVATMYRKTSRGGRQ